MLTRLIVHSFRRDLRKKAVAMAAVALATCLATFLLNWSFNLGDKIQKDLRAYGANILILPQGESLQYSESNEVPAQIGSDQYLQTADLQKIETTFWKNQIVGLAPILPVSVQSKSSTLVLVGTEFGNKDAKMDLRKASPYLVIDGSWPRTDDEAVAGAALAQRFGWKKGSEVPVESDGNLKTFRLSGIVRSGGIEEEQLIAPLSSVQALTGSAGKFKQLLVSAIVTPHNQLYQKFQRNPSALTPQEFERFSCTPYVTSVAKDIAKAFNGAEARIVRRVSQSDEKISHKMNWLMFLVTLAALIASSLTMTSTTTAMILERRKELALMKAIGSQNAFLLTYLFIEVLILGILGSLIGFAVGSFLSTGLSKAIFDSSMELKWAVLPLVGTIGVLIILCGSLWPLRQAITLEPAQALKDL